MLFHFLSSVEFKSSALLGLGIEPRRDVESALRCVKYPWTSPISTEPSTMNTRLAFLPLTIWSLAVLTASTSSNCCNGKMGGEVIEMETDCSNCDLECNCSAEDCELCEGNEKCCRTCCETRCDCHTMKCNSCSSQYNQCCARCCGSSKCRNFGCSMTKSCNQCTCDACGGKQIQQNSCCDSCCNKKTEKVVEERNVSTLPNITIIINHAPIYVNNTPIIKTENRCGNASLLTNGTHIVYVYPQNSTCSNRTCCTRQVRRACRPMPLPLPPVCPPPMYVPDCSPQCLQMQSASMNTMSTMGTMSAMGTMSTPCEYFQSWPYVHCPHTGCYGFTCSPPMMMPPSPPPMVVQGCIPVPAWPFIRCIPGAGGDSMVSYGPPSYQVLGPGGASPAVPFSSTDHSDGFSGGANAPPSLPSGAPTLLSL